jgi:hypothetical protein
MVKSQGEWREKSKGWWEKRERRIRLLTNGKKLGWALPSPSLFLFFLFSFSLFSNVTVPATVQTLNHV